MVTELAMTRSINGTIGRYDLSLTAWVLESESSRARADGTLIRGQTRSGPEADAESKFTTGKNWGPWAPSNGGLQGAGWVSSSS